MSQRLLSLAGLFVISAAVALSTACKKKTDSVIESTESNYTVQDKRIHFIYGSLIRSVSVSELEIFAQKGIAGGDIANFIKFGKLDANALRRQLSKEYVLDLVETSNILNNPVGTAILNKLGDAVHPHLTKNGSAQAVRSAIIASLQDDNKLTPLEVLRNLPVNMDVEIESVLKLKDELADAFLKG